MSSRSGHRRVRLHRRPLHPAGPGGRARGPRDAAQSGARAEEVRGQLERAGAKGLDRLSFAAADLERDAGWPEAVAGCDFVLHVASPFPARRAEGRGRPDPARARRRAPGAQSRPRRGGQARRADLLVRRRRLRPSRRRPRRSTRRAGRTSTARASAPMPSRRRSPSAPPGISSPRRAGRNSPSSIRSACSGRCSARTCRRRSSSSSACWTARCPACRI